MPPKLLDYNATLVERVDLTPSLAVFRIRADEPLDGEPPFVPGQYVTLGLNNDDRPELGSVRRPMSIASAPEDRDALEFYIRFVGRPESDNPLTHLLWKTAEGDRLYLRPKAVGHFTLNHTIGTDDPRRKVFVAAGTGLAPFISIVRSRLAADPQADLSDCVILHGASYPDDLGYRAELEELQANGSTGRGLHYFSTISRPHEVEAWVGDHGRVEDFFLPARLAELEERIGLGPGELRPEHATVFICGLQGTIAQTIVRLLDRGFVPDNRKLRRAFEVEEHPPSLFYEQYDATPVIDVKNPDVLDPLRARLHAALGGA
ncbi:MAG: ferredoxin--NADP reductase [Acidobacteriota bacterium]